MKDHFQKNHHSLLKHLVNKTVIEIALEATVTITDAIALVETAVVTTNIIDAEMITLEEPLKIVTVTMEKATLDQIELIPKLKRHQVLQNHQITPLVQILNN